MDSTIELTAKAISLPEDVSHLTAKAISLPEHICEEINQCVSELSRIARRQKIDEIASDIRYKYHMCQLQWVSKEFWNMMRTDAYHPRKIDTLANSHNFPSDWLPSSVRPNFDSGTWPFTTFYKTFMNEPRPDFRY